MAATQRAVLESPTITRMSTSLPAFREPSSVEKTFNRFFGFLVGLGMGPGYCYLLQVPGRKSGKLYSTPVNLLELNGKKYLVAPRGRRQWVRNAEAANQVTLKRGKNAQTFHLRPLNGPERLEVLKVYLDSFRGAVQRYFPAVQAGSPPQAFGEVAGNYPAFELIR